MYSIRTCAALLAAAVFLATGAAYAQTSSDELHMHVIQETSTFKKADIVSAEVGTEDNGHTVIHIVLSPDGAKRFAALTQKHIGKPMQIVVGDRILMTPRIHTSITGGRVQISGLFTREEAEAIVAQLR